MPDSLSKESNNSTFQLSPYIPSLLATFLQLNKTTFNFSKLIDFSTDTKTSTLIISAFCIYENYIFAGTHNGHVACYTTSGKSTKLNYIKKISDKRIDFIEAIYNDVFQCIAILSHRTIKIYHPTSLEYIDTSPLNNVTLINSSLSPKSCGLAAVSGNSLYLYNLDNGFEFPKAFHFNDPPISVQWYNDIVYLGFKKGYSKIICSTRTITKLSSSIKLPVIKYLPTGELAILFGNKLSFRDGRKETFSTTVKSKMSSHLCCSFPYLFSLSSRDSFIEVLNILDPNYRFIVDPPSYGKLYILKEEMGKIYASDSQNIYSLRASNDEKFSDSNIVSRICSNKDNVLFILYIKEVFSTENTVFNNFLNILLNSTKETIEKESSHTADLERLKNIVTSCIDKAYNVMYEVTKNYITPSQVELMYFALSIYVHNQLYDYIRPILDEIVETDNIKYNSYIKILKSMTVSQFGIRERFHLNDDSVVYASSLDNRKHIKTNQFANTNQETEDSETHENMKLSHILNNLSIRYQLQSEEESNDSNFTYAGKVDLYIKENDKFDFIFIGKGKLYYDIDYQNIIRFKDRPPKVVSLGDGKFEFDIESRSTFWTENESVYMITHHEENEFKLFSNQFLYHSNLSNLSESMFINKQIVDSDEILEYQTPPLNSSGFLKIPPQVSRLNNKINLRSSDNILIKSKDTIKIAKFINDPYRPAYALLRSLTKRKSPREKIECIFSVLNKTISCIENFWKKKGKSIIVGADDLLPIFTYIVARAGVPNLPFEVKYINEFSSERILQGKYGYALITLQMAADSLKVIIKENLVKELNCDTSKTNSHACKT